MTRTKMIKYTLVDLRIVFDVQNLQNKNSNRGQIICILKLILMMIMFES